jgi:hypothetical protein
MGKPLRNLNNAKQATYFLKGSDSVGAARALPLGVGAFPMTNQEG